MIALIVILSILGYLLIGIVIDIIWMFYDALVNNKFPDPKNAEWEWLVVIAWPFVMLGWLTCVLPVWLLKKILVPAYLVLETVKRLRNEEELKND